MKYYFTILLALIVISCNNKRLKSVHVISEQTISDTLFAKERSISTNILMPVKTVIINDKLVIYNRYKVDMFKVFKIPSLDFLYCQGKIGNGPEEFNFIPDGSIKEYKNKLVLLDNFRFKELLVEDDKLRTITSQVVKADVNGIDNFTLLNDSIYICDNKSCENNYEFMMVDRRGKKIIKHFGDYPKFSKRIKTCDERYMCGLKILTSRSSDGRVAVFYLYANIAKLYDRKGCLLSETNIGNGEIIDHVPNDSDIMYRAGVYSNSKYIYVLNVNAPTDNYFDNKSKYKPRFEIWNWNGQLLATYVLNKAILSFAVSDKYNKVYATTLDEISKIYEFELPPL